MRVVVALGGNAIADERGVEPKSQRRAVERAALQLADLLAEGHDVVITHGNGPQVGNLLMKNELARDVVPPVPLDWCVAQTQATIGMLIVTALEPQLRARGIDRPVAVVITRVRVAADDPAWEHPTKPIGWREARRVVPSPEPLEILERPLIERLLADGEVVVAGGGGGIPMVREDGVLRGVEAVIDKDLTGALLAQVVGARCLVMATDVEAAAVAYGTPAQRWLGAIGAADLRALAAEGHFAGGSMGPKVEAALRFVGDGGERAAIGSLARLRAAAEGTSGTQVTP